MKKKLLCCVLFALLISCCILSCAFADTIASSMTPLDDASTAQKHNIDLAISMLDGTWVDFGDTFSFNDTVGPRTSEEGYRVALNGRGAKAIAGGVSQTASTLYLALQKLDGIEYEKKKTYGDKYVGTYVDSSKDAIVTDYKNNIDFAFTNYYGEFTISMWRDADYIYCSLDNDDEYEYDDYSDAVGFSSIYIDGTVAMEDNITLAADSINGTTLEHNDIFSFNEIVGPRTERYGYRTALNGRGVKVTGGGVAQVASAVWLAIKDLDDVEIIEKRTYGSKYNQYYVEDEEDAIVTDYKNDLDFSFRYRGYGVMTVYTFVDEGDLICEITVD